MVMQIGYVKTVDDLRKSCYNTTNQNYIHITTKIYTNLLSMELNTTYNQHPFIMMDYDLG